MAVFYFEFQKIHTKGTLNKWLIISQFVLKNKVLRTESFFPGNYQKLNEETHYQSMYVAQWIFSA